MFDFEFFFSESSLKKFGNKEILINAQDDYLAAGTYLIEDITELIELADKAVFVLEFYNHRRQESAFFIFTKESIFIFYQLDKKAEIKYDFSILNYIYENIEKSLYTEEKIFFKKFLKNKKG